MNEKTKQILNEKKLPPVGMPVQVQCDGFRCMASRDETGVWRSTAKGEILQVIEVAPD
jgi:hypothetical protein